MSIDFFPQIQGSKTLELASKLSREYQRQHVRYEGITENANPTELFIDNETGYRLQIPKNGCMVATWQGCAFNMTDGVGTTQAEVFSGIGQFSGRRADTSFLVGSVAIAGTGFAFTCDDSLDAMRCTVTGQAGKRIIWVCHLDVTFAGQISAPTVASPFYTGVQ